MRLVLVMDRHQTLRYELDGKSAEELARWLCEELEGDYLLASTPEIEEDKLRDGGA
jgi:hypothetical protein